MTKSHGKLSEPHLTHHLSKARQIPYSRDGKWVIFSDLHMGNGTRKDDFVGNSDMFARVIEEYYGIRGYTLILNGDVEELQKFTWRGIKNHWGHIYRLFDAFHQDNRLLKTVGNHDSRLILDLKDIYPYKVDTVLEFTGLEAPILVYHGHQVSAFYEHYNDISRIGLRYFVMPLGIKNYSVAHDSRRRHNMERRIYAYSRQEGLISIIGHTHRPLFESMSKSEMIRYRIEYLVGRYRKAEANRRNMIEQEILGLREELKDWKSGKRRPEVQSGIYDTVDIPVPCVFNSGTVIGKRGMTCLEMTKGKIRLVHWFDKRVDDHYLMNDEKPLETLPGGDIHRMVLRKATMNYVMDSLRLLG